MAEQTGKRKGDRVVIGDRAGVVIFGDRDGGVVVFDVVRAPGEQDYLLLTAEELDEAPCEPAQLNELFAAVERIG